MAKNAINSELNKTGVVVVKVPHDFDKHDIVVESASTQTYVIKRKVIRGSRFVPFESNNINSDSSGTWFLPGTEYFEFTPSSTDEYSVIINSVEE